MATFSLVAKVIVQGLEQFQQLTADIEKADTASKNAGKTLKTLTTNTKKAGDAAKDAAASFKVLADAREEVGSAAAKAAPKIRSAGKATAGAAEASKKSRMSLEEAASAFRAMGASGTLAGDTLERFSIIASGPAGAAIAGLVVGAAAAMAGFKALEFSVTQGIATNKKYTQQVDSLKSELRKTAAILGQVLLDVIGFGNAMETSHGKVKKFNGDVVRDSTQVADAMRDIFIAVLKGVRFIGNGILGIKAIITGIGTAIGGLAAIVVNAFSGIPDLAAEMMLSVAKAIRTGLEDLGVPSTMLDQFFGTEDELKRRLRRATAGADQAAAAHHRIFAGIKDDFSEIYDGLEKWNDGLTNMIQGLEKSKGTAATITLDRDPDAKEAPADPVAAALAAARGEVETARGKAMDPELHFEYDPFQERIFAYQQAMPQMTADIDAARAALAEFQEETDIFGGHFFKVVDTLKDTMVELWDTTVSSFSAMSEEVFNFLGAFAMGESTLSEFKDAMLDVAGDIANTYGDLFIKQGAGLILFNPAIGSALIAAGLALKFLGGMALAKGSANAGSSGGAGRSKKKKEEKDLVKELTRELRPSGGGEGAVTNIEVIIGGRSIQPEMVAIVDDIARQRRSRYLGRRMGAF